MNESDRRLSPDLADAIRLGDDLAKAAMLYVGAAEEDRDWRAERLSAVVLSMGRWDRWRRSISE